MSIAQIKSIHFENFKVLQNATLPLGRFTLIVGANGSGKSTAMQALSQAGTSNAGPNPRLSYDQVISANLRQADTSNVVINIEWETFIGNVKSTVLKWTKGQQSTIAYLDSEGAVVPHGGTVTQRNALSRFRLFSFNASALTTVVQLTRSIELASDGSNLAGVIDNLRDGDDERFEALNKELGRWLPEFDRILFETPTTGHRSFLLRTRIGRHKIQAADLSQGTLFAVAFLTLAHLPNPPRIVCFEEPERGIHPRLLREIQDGMYRLAYPENYGDQRDPVQVIATTHSPYLLDLYKDHPEEIVIASKEADGTKFERLSDKIDVDEFLQGAPLGEVWYSGILGGVPLHT